jgi:hypothetical protein
MPASLLEISGVAFKEGDSNMLYAEQDEEGKVFYLKPGDTKAQHTKFGKNGDYEDIAICGDKVILLKSDGSLYVFPLVKWESRKQPMYRNIKMFYHPANTKAYAAITWQINYMYCVRFAAMQMLPGPQQDTYCL